MIPRDWKKTTLGDLVTFQRGYDLPKSEFRSGKHPIAGSNGIIGFHNRYTTRGPSITLGRSGNLGTPYYYDSDFWAHNTVLFAKEFHNSDPKFIYYLLQTIDFKQFNSGSAVPSLNRNYIHPLEVVVPERIETQREIANKLSAFDERIELNRKTNQTLGEMAQAIFKEWFIDFNYPGATGEMVESPLGPIPKDWRVVPLDQMATFLNGLALQKYPPVPDETPIPVIKIKELRNGVTESSDLASRAIPEQYIVENGDLLFSWSGSLDVMFWAGGDGALNQHLFKVTSDEYPLWFVFLWIKHHLPNFRGIAADKATTMGHIKRIDLTEALCLIPDDLVTAENTFDPLFKLHHQNELENETLRNVRDNLLPKLMNGEIEV